MFRNISVQTDRKSDRKLQAETLTGVVPPSSSPSTAELPAGRKPPDNKSCSSPGAQTPPEGGRKETRKRGNKEGRKERKGKEK